MAKRTTFRAVTEHQNWRSKDGTFIRTSQSHDAERPFTHVVLIRRRFQDDRGECWFAQSWAGSQALATKAAEEWKRHIRSGGLWDIQEVLVVPAEIVK